MWLPGAENNSFDLTFRQQICHAGKKGSSDFSLILLLLRPHFPLTGHADHLVFGDHGNCHFIYLAVY